MANAKEGLRAFNTKGLELHNVRIDADNGIPYLIRDSAELDLDGVADAHSEGRRTGGAAGHQ